LGNDPGRADAQRLRGQRAFCSNRGRRGGCGRTVAIFFAEVLPRHSVTTGLLTRLLSGLQQGGSLKAVAEALGAPFALETFYRLRQRLRRRLDQMRVCLHREQRPPRSTQSDPLLQTFEHLRCAFPGEPDPAAGFQGHFQRAILG
jgi:hypothetical protein